MPSTYTTSGIELIGDGEQSGTWGSTTNENLQILNRMISEAGTITLSGTTHTLTVTDGALSEGHYAVLVFGGSPSGTNTVTITPNDAKRTYFVKNDSGESVTLTQGSGGNVTVADGDVAIVYCDGAGAGAAVVDISGLTSNDIGVTVQAYSSVLQNTTASFTTADETKLDGIETGADVTDTANVTAAGALMDSELTDIASVKALNQGVATTDSPTFDGLFVDTTGVNATLGLTSGSTIGTSRIHFGDPDNVSAGQLRYEHANNAFNWYTGSSEKMRLQGGNLGIGTSSPSEKLSVTGNISVTGTVDGRDVAADGAKLDGIDAGADVTDTANVTAAGALMDSELTDITSVKALNQGVATTDSPTFSQLSLSSQLTIGSTMSHDGDPDTFVGFTTDRVVIEAGGYDGIEVQSDRVRVHDQLFVQAVTQPSLYFGDSASPSDGAITFTNGSSTLSAYAKSEFSVQTAASERFRITPTGNVGIGTSSPSTTLDVNGDLTITDKIIHSGDTNTAIRFPAADTFTVETGGAERIRVDNGGTLLVGKSATAPTTEGFEFRPDGLAIFTNSDGQNAQFRRTATTSTYQQSIAFFGGSMDTGVGSISVNSSSTSYNTTSDYRLKKNVTEVADPVDAVMALNPVEFSFVADPSNRVSGFLAHEVQAVIPNAVTGEKDAVDENGDPVYQSVDHSKIVPMLTAALQKALGEIETLKAEVASLKGA